MNKLGMLCVLVVFCCRIAASQSTPSLTDVQSDATGFMLSNSITVKLTGTGLKDGATVEFDTPNIMQSTVTSGTNPGGTQTTAVFTLVASLMAMPSSIGIRVDNGSGAVSSYKPFKIVTETDVCVEAQQSGGCTLRWEIQATGINSNNSQTNNKTTPQILVTLDYQFRAPRFNAFHSIAKSDKKNFKASFPGIKASGSLTDLLSGHADFKAGFTQALVANQVQPVSTTNGSCPKNSSSSTSSTTCTVAVPQDAFITEIAGKLGLTWAVDGQGKYAEAGLGIRGSGQYLISQNQIVQNNGLSYVSLSSLNPQDVVGFYETTGHFRIFQHDTTMPDGTTQNASSFLIIEGGYQNNRGLAELIGNSPQTNTRNRYVARFYLYPELPNTNHTKITVGMEYTGGIDGGPHTVQIVFGTNLNPAKLFNNKSSQ
jgi:hypothetical protein